ncbi:MAG: LLM class flavin-dependent oxidoreductase, partial [Dehalococcoidia bacterium]|nr:LLM class flavin-dependent oxidoreductase [Dehalococcoidia bacterium]
AMWGENPDNNYERFEETLEILRRGMQSEFLDFHGDVFHYSELWMELRPYQKPHPPLWWAGSARSAAERGANFIANGSVSQIATVTREYLEAWETAKANDGEFMYRPAQPLYGGTRRILICDSDEEARERALPAYDSYRSHFAKPAREGGEATKGAAGAFNEIVRNSQWFKEQKHEATPQARPNTVATMRLSGEEAIESEALLVGSPKTIKDYVERYVEESGANYFCASFQWGDLTHAEASKSLRLFTEHVMPAFTKA